MANMVPHEAFACWCAEGDVVLQQSYKPKSYASETFWMWIFLWKETRLRELMSSPGAPSTPSYSAGHSTPPTYYSGPSTPTNYSLRSLRNRECSNCKHLRLKIRVLKATMEMHMHPEQHTFNSAALIHEVLNEMEKLDLEYLVCHFQLSVVMNFDGGDEQRQHKGFRCRTAGMEGCTFGGCATDLVVVGVVDVGGSVIEGDD
ncbi:hypothetical protein Tco_0349739 [Tanacetum coccineum]